MNRSRWLLRRYAGMRRVPWTRPSVGEVERQAVEARWMTGWLSQGREVERFEKEICEFVGCRYAVCVSSGTAGLYLAAMAAREIWGREDDSKMAYCPASTFPSTVLPFVTMGMSVAPVDVGPSRWSWKKFRGR